MANNVVEVQTIRDDDRYVTIKVTGVANAAWSNSGVLLVANSLFGANASQSFCPLSLTDIKFSMDVGGNAYVQFNWIGGGANGNVNTTIMTFGQIGSSTFDGQSIYNNANTPTGDVGWVVNSLAAGNSFNFVLTFVKDQQPMLFANVSGNPAAWSNTVNAYNVPWA